MKFCMLRNQQLSNEKIYKDRHIDIHDSPHSVIKECFNIQNNITRLKNIYIYIYIALS